MGTDRKKIILFDMDMTLVDSSIAKQYGKNYKEVQKHISEFAVFDGIKEVIEQLSEQHIIYVVSGNVGSTIKKVALANILQNLNISKSDIIYIGDEVDDYKACQDSRIDFIGCVWGNDELKHNSEIIIANTPKEIIDTIGSIS